MAVAIKRIPYAARDGFFVLLIVTCVVFSAAAIFSGLEKREAALLQGGARQVDAAKIRRQILDGHLSPQQALFYKKAPR